MIKVEISHAGKKYNSLESATAAATAEGMRKVIEDSIMSFKDEVNKEGGTVNIQVNFTSLDDMTATLKVSNISKELKEKIENTLYRNNE